MSTDNPRPEAPRSEQPVPPAHPVVTPITVNVDQDTPAKKEATPPPPLKLFSLNDVKRVVPVSVKWESMYPGYQPWEFKFGLMLSDDVQRKREEWLAAPQSDTEEKSNTRKQMMTEICDLLRDMPTGFGELQGVVVSPGQAVHDFVTRIADPEQKETVYRILQTAWNGYWAKAMPTTFRQDVPNSGS